MRLFIFQLRMFTYFFFLGGGGGIIVLNTTVGHYIVFNGTHDKRYVYGGKYFTAGLSRDCIDFRPA
jgi:hypothetical protein